MRSRSFPQTARPRPLMVKTADGLLTLVYLSERTWSILKGESGFSLKRLYRKLAPGRSSEEISRDIETMVLCHTLDRARREYGLANDNEPGDDTESRALLPFRFDRRIAPPPLPRLFCLFRFMPRPRHFTVIEPALKRKNRRNRS